MSHRPLWPVIGLALLTACASAPRARTAPDRLSMDLRVSPSVGFAPLYVQALIVVWDPGRLAGCPQFALFWALLGDPAPEGASSFPGDACGPDGPLLHSPRPRLLLLRRAGEYVVVASMADAGVALSDTATVQVIGRGEE